MKKKLLFLSVLFIAFRMNAQYSIVDQDSNLFVDGMIAEYGTIDPLDASLEFYVTNDGASTIYTRIDFESAVNADGTGFELCYGNCYVDLIVGQSVPPTPEFITIEPGATTPLGNHFLNTNPGNGTDVLDYVFRFYETDAAGLDIGNALTLTYRYNPLLGVNDSNKLNVNVYPTVVTDKLVIEVDQELDLKVYDLLGRIVKNQKLNIGRQQINMSDLSSQLYLLHFENNQGVSYTTKVIVK